METQTQTMTVTELSKEIDMARQMVRHYQELVGNYVTQLENEIEKAKFAISGC